MTWKPTLEPGSTEIDLTGLTEGTHPLVLDGGKAELEVAPEAFLRAYRFTGTLSQSGEDCQVRGSLIGNLVSACDRCLVPFDRSVAVEVEVDVVRRAADSVESVEEVTEGVIRLSPSDTRLDLAAPFRAAVLLDEPIKHLCRDDCRGLCPVCGTNRNESACKCDSSQGDPRWDALKDLSFPDPKE
jgi:uncharacterized metal-binding protein YceD (DUF177 family)